MEADLYEEINGMIQLYLIRHSMTAGNLKKRYIGRTDESLCPEGIVLLEKYIQKYISGSPEGICKSHEALHGNSKIDFQRKLL